MFHWKHTIHYAHYLPLFSTMWMFRWYCSIMLEMPHFPQIFQWHPVSIKRSYFVPRPDVAGVDEHVHLVSRFDLLLQRFVLLAVRISSLNFFRCQTSVIVHQQFHLTFVIYWVHRQILNFLHHWEPYKTLRTFETRRDVVSENCSVVSMLKITYFLCCKFYG